MVKWLGFIDLWHGGGGGGGVEKCWVNVPGGPFDLFPSLLDSSKFIDWFTFLVFFVLHHIFSSVLLLWGGRDILELFPTFH